MTFTETTDPLDLARSIVEHAPTGNRTVSILGFALLLALSRRPIGVPTTWLCERIGLPIATGHAHVTDLEKSGLVARRPSDFDRRVTLVTLTPKGMQYLCTARNRGAASACDVDSGTS